MRGSARFLSCLEAIGMLRLKRRIGLETCLEQRMQKRKNYFNAFLNSYSVEFALSRGLHHDALRDLLLGQWEQKWM